MKIDGARVIVTGGASGIGLGVIRDLASRGAVVWGVDRDAAAISSAVAGGDEVGISWICADIGFEREAVDAVSRIASQAGRIDVLVNNAAVLRDQMLVAKLGRQVKAHSSSDWDETLRCNLTSAFLMTREVAQTMMQRKTGGVVINMSSVARHGNAGQSAYAATKAGLIALTTTWSQELSPLGIRVVAIAPGFVETPMTRSLPEVYRERWRERTPLRRFGTLAEMAHAVRFAVENDYLNGKVLDLDGGLRF